MSEIKCIYSYYETLLQVWNDWNDGVLYGRFPQGASNFTDALGVNTSNGRTRAKEIYRIGLLKEELTKGEEGLNYIRNGKNIQSDLGYISALISRAATLSRSAKIDKALSALCAIYAIIQSVRIDNIEISINTVIQRLNDVYPCPSDIGFVRWHRYLLSAFFCEIKYLEVNGRSLRSFVKFITDGEDCPPMTIRSNKENGYKERKTICSQEDITDAVKKNISLTNILQQKAPLFIFGDVRDDPPKGFYGMAIKHNATFLRLCYEIEKNNMASSPFSTLYDEDTNESTKGDVLVTIANIFAHQDKNKQTIYFGFMKTIYEGAIEALRILNPPLNHASLRQGTENLCHFLSALRTKPFMLLAGISGTGKSRLVREMAFMSCPKALQDQDQTQPGNFCMIEVKPNWHDSTELLGYWSNISKKYMFTPFVKFLVKAMMYPDVPFFVCLDEMNLAPVEQYLAELLSVLETRKRTGDKRIRTGALVSSEYFVKLAVLDCTRDENKIPYKYLKTDKEIYMKLFSLTSLQGDENGDALAAKTLCTSGLTLPDNVIIIGTVNMDDTTHKFSRKVIDRAMTIEMNGGELNSIFGGSSRLEYRADNEVVGLDKFKAKYVSADDAINDCLPMSPFAERVTGGEEENGTLAHRLKAINDCLEGTPFQVSYRVMNELVIYLAVLLDSEDGEVSDERFDELMSQAVDDILLMKILPRIEGDEQMFVTSGGNRLDSLLALTSPNSASHKKLLEMKERLEKSFFTRFWP